MQLEVLEKEDCEKLKMGCYLAVAACSTEPLKFIHLTYKPKGSCINICMLYHLLQSAAFAVRLISNACLSQCGCSHSEAVRCGI